uniref:Uncharacterized protein n=1 Tax=Rhizophora mucronata TaxID=61149 RepID=A0A2P2R0A8_RHIMU
MSQSLGQNWKQHLKKMDFALKTWIISCQF